MTAKLEHVNVNASGAASASLQLICVTIPRLGAEFGVMLDREFDLAERPVFLSAEQTAVDRWPPGVIHVPADLIARLQEGDWVEITGLGETASFQIMCRETLDLSDGPVYLHNGGNLLTLAGPDNCQSSREVLHAVRA